MELPPQVRDDGRTVPTLSPLRLLPADFNLRPHFFNVECPVAFLDEAEPFPDDLAGRPVLPARQLFVQKTL